MRIYSLSDHKAAALAKEHGTLDGALAARHEPVDNVPDKEREFTRAEERLRIQQVYHDAFVKAFNIIHEQQMLTYELRKNNPLPKEAQVVPMKKRGER